MLEPPLTGENVRKVNLDAIRRRAAAATPGPWKIGSRFGCGVLGSAVAVISGKLPPIELDPHRNGRADAAFIAHARQDVPALLAEVDRLRNAGPAGVDADEWDAFLLRLEEYRDRDVEGTYTEANEMSQDLTEKCVKLFLPKEK